MTSVWPRELTMYMGQLPICIFDSTSIVFRPTELNVQQCKRNTYFVCVKCATGSSNRIYMPMALLVVMMIIILCYDKTCAMKTLLYHSLHKCPGNVSWNCSWSKWIPSSTKLLLMYSYKPPKVIIYTCIQFVLKK